MPGQGKDEETAREYATKTVKVTPSCLRDIRRLAAELGVLHHEAIGRAVRELLDRIRGGG